MNNVITNSMIDVNVLKSVNQYFCRQVELQLDKIINTIYFWSI